MFRRRLELFPPIACHNSCMRFISRLLLLLVIVSPLRAENAPPRVLFLGDSLTEGYGLSKEDAYPALVESILNKEGAPITAVNAGISGSTTASALSRLRWHLKAKPDVLVLALGANDGLRGLPVDSIRKNLTEVLTLAEKEKMKILFVGMKTPPNYGPAYSRAFDKMFADLSKQHRVTFLPFLLDRIAGEPQLNQADGIHPNAEGQKVMARAIAKALRPLVTTKSS
jgi:acyl-CoA thioesterase I